MFPPCYLLRQEKCRLSHGNNAASHGSNDAQTPRSVSPSCYGSSLENGKPGNCESSKQSEKDLRAVLFADRLQQGSNTDNGKGDRTSLTDLERDFNQIDHHKPDSDIRMVRNHINTKISKEPMEEHQQSIRAPPTAHKCAICLSTFASATNVRTHVRYLLIFRWPQCSSDWHYFNASLWDWSSSSNGLQSFLSSLPHSIVMSVPYFWYKSYSNYVSWHSLTQLFPSRCVPPVHHHFNHFPDSIYFLSDVDNTMCCVQLCATFYHFVFPLPVINTRFTGRIFDIDPVSTQKAEASRMQRMQFAFSN